MTALTQRERSCCSFAPRGEGSDSKMQLRLRLRGACLVATPQSKSKQALPFQRKSGPIPAVAQLALDGRDTLPTCFTSFVAKQPLPGTRLAVLHTNHKQTSGPLSIVALTFLFLSALLCKSRQRYFPPVAGATASKRGRTELSKRKTTTRIPFRFFCRFVRAETTTTRGPTIGLLRSGRLMGVLWCLGSR